MLNIVIINCDDKYVEYEWTSKEAFVQDMQSDNENIFLFDVADGCNGGLIIANDLDDAWEKLAADRDCPVKDFKKMACIAPITTLDLTRNIHNLY